MGLVRVKLNFDFTLLMIESVLFEVCIHKMCLAPFWKAINVYYMDCLYVHV